MGLCDGVEDAFPNDDPVLLGVAVLPSAEVARGVTIL